MERKFFGVIGLIGIAIVNPDVTAVDSHFKQL